MATDDIRRGPVHQAEEDNVQRVVTTNDARQGRISGRVLAVLGVSVVLLVAAYAIMLFTHATL